MSLTFSRFKELASDKLAEVKENASARINEIRNKRNYELSPNDQALEDEVDAVQKSCTVLSKKLTEAFPDDERKIGQHSLGLKMMQTGESVGDTTPFGAAFLKCGRVQLDLGQLRAFHNRSVMEHVQAPLMATLDSEMKTVNLSRKELQTAKSSLDSSAQKYSSMSARAVKHGPAKVEAMRDEVEDKEQEYGSCRDKFVEKLFGMVSRDKEFIEPLITLMEEQYEFHKSALALIDAARPVLEEMKQAAGSRGVFGGALSTEPVDPVIVQCAAVINRDGLDVEGLFRLAGSSTKTRKLRAAFNNGTVDMATPEGYSYDIHSVSSLFKVYFRELDEPLLTCGLFGEWMAASKVDDHDQQLYAIKGVLEKLPAVNYSNLRFISQFLAGVAANSAVNKMAASNIALVVGPNLLWPPSNSLGGTIDTSGQTKVFEQLITYADWFFGEGTSPVDPTIRDPPAFAVGKAVSARLRRGASSNQAVGGGTAPIATPAAQAPAPPAPVARPRLPSRTNSAPRVKAPAPPPSSAKPKPKPQPPAAATKPSPPSKPSPAARGPAPSKPPPNRGPAPSKPSPGRKPVLPKKPVP